MASKYSSTFHDSSSLPPRAGPLSKLSPTKYLRCVVEMLDNSETEIDIERSATGGVLFKEVINSLDLAEPDYFGLQFSWDSSKHEWLEHEKLMRKQLKAPEKDLFLSPTFSKMSLLLVLGREKCLSQPPYKLYFRVRFFPTEPSRVAEDLTRYHMFLNIKNDLMTGSLTCPTETAAELSSLVVQSETGDYHPKNLPDQYICDFQFIPNQTPEFEERVFHFHKQMIGMSPAQAELKFLEIAKRLELYGSEVQKARDSDGHSIEIVICSEGIKIYRESKRLNIFAWSRIEKVLFNRRNFYVQLLPDVERDPASKSVLGFTLPSIRSCKMLWKCTVAHHTFYRTSYRERYRRVPKLIRFGSTYRYRGRTQCQVIEAARRSFKRERVFRRTGSSRPFEKSLGKGNSTSSVLNNHGLTDADAESDASSTMTTTRGSYDVMETSDWESRSPPSLSPVSGRDSEMNGILNDEGLLDVSIQPNANGQFGLNFKGGAEQKLKPIITQIAPNSPASSCDPQLQEGDEIVYINGRPAEKLSHEQICCLIRSIGQSATCKTLMLSVRPYGNIKNHEIKTTTTQDISKQLLTSMAHIRQGLENGDLLAFYVDMPKRKPGLTTEAAHCTENKQKNRYRDILPYDFNRVVIRSENDYINASHVQMEIDYSGKVNEYLAAQGPLSDTCADFWQMIWDQDVVLVVMLTTTMENGKTKCHRYWPEFGDTFEIGSFEVSHVASRDFSPSYIHREFKLTNVETDEERPVQHLQYIAWPDHGVPEDSRRFLSFVNEVRRLRATSSSPVAIHCSAGVGRTGVFIAVETAACLIEAGIAVSPEQMLDTMRAQRPSLVQTPGQFKFACEAFLDIYQDHFLKTHAKNGT